MTSDSRREADETSAVLRYSVTYGGNFFPMFPDDLSVPSSRAKLSKVWQVVPKRR